MKTKSPAKGLMNAIRTLKETMAEAVNASENWMLHCDGMMCSIQTRCSQNSSSDWSRNQQQ